MHCTCVHSFDGCFGAKPYTLTQSSTAIFSCVRSRHIMCAHFSFKQTLNVRLWMWMCCEQVCTWVWARMRFFFVEYYFAHSMAKIDKWSKTAGNKREEILLIFCSFFCFLLSLSTSAKLTEKLFEALSLSHTHFHQSYLHLTLNTLNDSKKLNVHNSGRIVFLRHYFRNFRLAFSAKRVCYIVHFTEVFSVRSCFCVCAFECDIDCGTEETENASTHLLALALNRMIWT